jgi:F5/8 type C domain
MQSRGNRAIRVCVMLAVGRNFFGCAVYSGSLLATDNGGSSGAVFASGGVSGSGSGGVSSAQDGDAASGGEGALPSSGSSSGSSGSAESFGQGAGGGAGIGGSAQGLGGSTESSAGMGSGASVGTKGGSGNGGSAGHGGNAGAGGNSGPGDCTEHPLTAKSTWIITASNTSAASPLANIDDGNLLTRWSTGISQKSDWLQVDFGADVSLASITLAIGDNSSDYPRAYEVRLSELSQNRSATPLASGKGQEAMDTVIDLPKPVAGRYLLISQTGTINGTWWSIAELKVACLR